MITQELLEYIKHHTQAGQTKDQIKHSLVAAGWRETDVEEGFAAANGGPTPPPMAPAMAGAAGPGGQLPGPISLLGEAGRVYKSRFWTILGIHLLPVLVIAIGSALLFGGWATTSVFQKQLGTTGYAATNIATFLLFLLLIIAAVMVSIWSQVSLIYAVKDREEKIGLTEAFRRGSHKIGSYLGASLIAGLAIFGGMILLIIPGIIFAVWFSLAAYIVVGDNATAMQAVKRSRDYVRGNWWKIFGRFLFLILVFVVISIIASIVSGLLTGIIISTTQGAGKEAIAGIIEAILSGILAPVYVVYGYLMYEHLKKVKGESAVPASGSKSVILFVVLAVIIIIALFLGSIVLLALNSARAKSRDAKRIADSRLLQSGLELYLNDHNKYPDDLKQLTPVYLVQELTVPVPADGTCTDSQNTYSYQVSNNNTSYQLTFCLGQAFGGYQAGVNTVEDSALILNDDYFQDTNAQTGQENQLFNP